MLSVLKLASLLTPLSWRKLVACAANTPRLFQPSIHTFLITPSPECPSKNSKLLLIEDEPKLWVTLSEVEVRVTAFPDGSTPLTKTHHHMWFISEVEMRVTTFPDSSTSLTKTHLP